MVKHAEVHPGLDVEGCFGCRVSGVRFAPSATPTRSKGAAHAASANAMERRWEKDLPAYKRLRDQGLQPERVDGSHRLEQTATERHHIEGGVDPKLVERVLA